MKERGIMPRQGRLIQLPLVGKVLLCLLAIVYAMYLAAFGRFLYASVFPFSERIAEHPVETTADVVIQHWTVDNMLNATDADQQTSNVTDLTQENIDTSAGKAAKQQGQAPRNGNADYPLSTVGKVFFTNATGQNMVCSGTAIVSLNQS